MHRLVALTDVKGQPQHYPQPLYAGGGLKPAIPPYQARLEIPVLLLNPSSLASLLNGQLLILCCTGQLESYSCNFAQVGQTDSAHHLLLTPQFGLLNLDSFAFPPLATGPTAL